MRAGLVSQPIQGELLVCKTFEPSLIKAIVTRTLITGTPPIPVSALMLKSTQISWRVRAGKVKSITRMKRKGRNN
jgi:hypothetical protein